MYWYDWYLQAGQAASKSVSTASTPKETTAVPKKEAPKESAIPKKEAAAAIPKKDTSSAIPKKEPAIPKKESVVWQKEVPKKDPIPKKSTVPMVKKTVVPEVAKRKEPAQVDVPQKTRKRKLQEPEPKQVTESCASV